MINQKDFLYGLDALTQYIAEKDKAEEIHFQIMENDSDVKEHLYDKIIKDLSALKFKWHSTIKDKILDNFKEIYRIKILPEVQEEYSKKKK